jgi:hypothetical protein
MLKLKSHFLTVVRTKFGSFKNKNERENDLKKKYCTKHESIVNMGYVLIIKKQENQRPSQKPRY